MGGFGALHNGFNNPDVFIAVTGNAPGGATLEINPYDRRVRTYRLIRDVYGSDRDYFIAHGADDARGEEPRETSGAIDSDHLRHGGRPVSWREVRA